MRKPVLHAHCNNSRNTNLKYSIINNLLVIDDGHIAKICTGDGFFSASAGKITSDTYEGVGRLAQVSINTFG